MSVHQSNGSRARRFTLLAATAAVGLLGMRADAALIVWDGGTAGTNQSWNTAGNWNPDTLPTSTDIAQFGAAGTQTNILVQPGNAGTQVVGEISQAGTLARFIGTSGGSAATPFTGTIQINGVVGGVAGTGTGNYLLQNSSAVLLTVGNFVNNTTTLALPNAGIVDVQSTGGITISEKLSGAGRITKIGSGTLTLSSTASANTGGIQIDGGTASFGSTSSFLTTTGGYVANQIGIANGSTFIYTGTVATATIGYAVGIQLGTGGGVMNINNAATTFSQAGIISGNGDLTKTGPGTLSLVPATSAALSTSNSFTGRLIVSNGTVSSYTTTSAGNPAAFTADQLTLDGGIFRYTDTGSTITFGTNRGVTITGNGGGIYVNSSTETLIIPAPIVSSGVTAGAFTTVSQGTLRTTGANTYAGTTTVGLADGTSTGYLRVNGSHTGGGSYFVQPGAHLGGSGSISLAPGASINVGGQLTPGASISATTAGLEYIDSLDVAGDVNLFNGTSAGNLLIEADFASTMPSAIDLLNVTGKLDLTGSTLTLNVLHPESFTGPVVFAKYSSLVGTFANDAAISANYTIDYNYQGTNSIALVAVPEPTTLAAVLGLSTLGLGRRRKA